MMKFMCFKCDFPGLIKQVPLYKDQIRHKAQVDYIAMLLIMHKTKNIYCTDGLAQHWGNSSAFLLNKMYQEGCMSHRVVAVQ